MKKVYLSGAIHQTEDAWGWRKLAANAMPKGWKAVTPMKIDKNINCTELVKADLADIDKCQALLVRADQPSWGTAMEIFYAYNKGIPVLAWPCFFNRAPWLTAHVTEFFGSLNEAVAGLKNYG